MSEKSKAEADKRRDELAKRVLNMPPKPREQKPTDESKKKPTKKRSAAK